MESTTRKWLAGDTNGKKKWSWLGYINTGLNELIRNTEWKDDQTAQTIIKKLQVSETDPEDELDEAKIKLLSGDGKPSVRRTARNQTTCEACDRDQPQTAGGDVSPALHANFLNGFVGTVVE